MSPAKRCDSAETFRKYQAKLAKAERNREKLLQAKYNRYVELSERVSLVSKNIVSISYSYSNNNVRVCSDC